MAELAGHWPVRRDRKTAAELKYCLTGTTGHAYNAECKDTALQPCRLQWLIWPVLLFTSLHL